MAEGGSGFRELLAVGEGGHLFDHGAVAVALVTGGNAVADKALDIKEKYAPNKVEKPAETAAPVPPNAETPPPGNIPAAPAGGN